MTASELKPCPVITEKIIKKAADAGERVGWETVLTSNAKIYHRKIDLDKYEAALIAVLPDIIESVRAPEAKYPRLPVVANATMLDGTATAMSERFSAEEFEVAAKFVDESSRYFAKQMTESTEDITHWAMRQNSANASEAADMLRQAAEQARELAAIKAKAITREDLAKFLCYRYIGNGPTKCCQDSDYVCDAWGSFLDEGDALISTGAVMVKK